MGESYLADRKIDIRFNNELSYRAFSTGVSKTLDGVKSANVKNNLEQEIQKYFDLHEDIVDLQLDTFLSKTNVLREMVQFLIDHKNVQLYKGAAVKEVVK